MRNAFNSAEAECGTLSIMRNAKLLEKHEECGGGMRNSLENMRNADAEFRNIVKCGTRNKTSVYINQ